MATNREDYLSKFKKLSKMNESVIKQVQEMDMNDEDEVPYASGVVSIGSTSEAEGDDKAPAAPAPEASPEGGADPLAAATPAPPQQTQTPNPGASGDTTVGAPAPEPEAGADPMADAMGAAGTESPEGISDPNVSMDGGMGMDMQPKQDDIQNELLKLQISALQKMSQKFDDIETQMNDLNSKLEKYSLEVEKVKEPNPVEKIENRWEDSYPFKYRLNDLWNGNVFQGGHDLFPKQDGAIKQQDDGSYIASYGDMNSMSDFDLKKSFAEGVEKLQKKINEQLSGSKKTSKGN
jgi:hypothetical protein